MTLFGLQTVDRWRMEPGLTRLKVGPTILNSFPSSAKEGAARQFVATGANLPRLSPTALGEMAVPLPPLDEQQRIAAILDKADELRTKRCQTLAHLDALTEPVFEAMYGPSAPRTG